MWCSESPSAICLEWRIIPPDTRYRLRVVDRKPCDFSKLGLSPTMEQTLLTDQDEFGPESVPPALMGRGGGRPPSQKAGDGRHRSVCQGSELQGPSQGMNNAMSSFRSLPPCQIGENNIPPGWALMPLRQQESWRHRKEKYGTLSPVFDLCPVPSLRSLMEGFGFVRH